MKIPHKVEIKPGIFYYVAYVDSFDHPDTIGYCFDKNNPSRNRMILLLKSQTPEDQYETFVHELLHAVEFEYGLKIPHKLIYDLQGPLGAVFKLNKNNILVTTDESAKKRTVKKKTAKKKKRG